MRPTFCSDAASVVLGLFDFTIAPPLLYYSYIPIVIISLILSIFALVRDNFSLKSKLVFAISASFSLWVISSIFQWIAAPVNLVMFSWQVLTIFEVATFIFTAYFVYVFLYKKDLPTYVKTLLFAVTLPIFVLLPTIHNIESFDLTVCEGVSSLLLLQYSYFIDFLAILWIGYMAVSHLLRRDIAKDFRRQGAVVAFGALSFVAVFFGTSLYGDIILDYDIELVGPIGALVFIVLMVYMSVKFHTFNSKLIASEALVGFVATLIFAILFIRTIENVRIVTSITLVLTIILGILLVRSVRREVRQREEIQKLAHRLQRANVRLRELDRQKSEFVSIASHQLRSPLTAIKGYASMLLEGSYGKMSEKTRDAVSRIYESSQYMVLSVEDFLNVSRIEQGRLKYEMGEVNLKDIAEQAVDELRPVAIKKGLVLMFRSSCDSNCVVRADIGKVKQVVMNLVDNAMKYTPKGSIDVIVSDDMKKKRVRISVLDTGVGMNKKTLDSIFEKFVRARNANHINTSGTGLGLFVAKQMVDAMKGRIWAESEGEGKGSAFSVEFKMFKGKK